MLGQALRQALVKGGMFHVDDDALNFFVGDQFGEAIRFFLRRERANRNVARTIGHDDEKRFDIRVSVFLVL